MNNNLKEKISEIFTKWNMPTRQIAINEILSLFKDELEKSLPKERKVEYYPQAYEITTYEIQEQQRAMGWNSCLERIIQNLEKSASEENKYPCNP